MRWQVVAASHAYCFALHVALARAFSCRYSSFWPGAVLPTKSSATRNTGYDVGSLPLIITMGTPPFVHPVPNGLGSWRVESVLDNCQEQPAGMFVFLFDDGSGEQNARRVGGSLQGGVFV